MRRTLMIGSLISVFALVPVGALANNRRGSSDRVIAPKKNSPQARIGSLLAIVRRVRRASQKAKIRSKTARDDTLKVVTAAGQDIDHEYTLQDHKEGIDLHHWGGIGAILLHSALYEEIEQHEGEVRTELVKAGDEVEQGLFHHLNAKASHLALHRQYAALVENKAKAEDSNDVSTNAMKELANKTVTESKKAEGHMSKALEIVESVAKKLGAPNPHGKS